MKLKTILNYPPVRSDESSGDVDRRHTRFINNVPCHHTYSSDYPILFHRVLSVSWFSQVYSQTFMLRLIINQGEDSIRLIFFLYVSFFFLLSTSLLPHSTVSLSHNIRQLSLSYKYIHPKMINEKATCHFSSSDLNNMKSTILF